MDYRLARRLSILTLVCLSGIMVSAQNEHCSDRISPEFDENTGQLFDDESCPFIVNVEAWMPGESSKIEIVSREGESVFQLFLVSMQLDQRIIGEIRLQPRDTVTMVTCGVTSAKNSDLSNKTEVEFEWVAPSDLTATDVILRASVGSLDQYWVDCDMYYVGRRENISTETTTEPTTTTTIPTTTTEITTTTQSTTTTKTRMASPDTANIDTTTRRLAPPDVGNMGTTPSTPTATGPISCAAFGNVYEIVAGTGCTEFKQKWNNQEWVHNCPPYTIFIADTDVCSCSYFGECTLP